MAEAPSSSQLTLPQEITKQVFVIMPFRSTQTRNALQLTSFFENQLRTPIESNQSFRYRYRVRRSESEFNITAQIIQDLFYADLLICDLSGHQPNPNVMYELGIRLSISSRPVILIRESGATTEPIFDIAGFHTHSYDPLDYSSLRRYIENKIMSFESQTEDFRSPILEILESQVPIVRTGRDKAAKLVNILEVGFYANLQVLASALNDYLSAGTKLRFSLPALRLSDEINAASEELQHLDWTDFRVVLTPHPALTHYLAAPYLTGLIDDQIDLSFSVELMRYHMNYFLEATWWLRFNPEKAQHFASDTSTMMLRCDFLAKALRATTDQAYQYWIGRLQGLFSQEDGPAAAPSSGDKHDEANSE